jgi:hypothetical protein
MIPDLPLCTYLLFNYLFCFFILVLFILLVFYLFLNKLCLSHHFVYGRKIKNLIQKKQSMMFQSTSAINAKTQINRSKFMFEIVFLVSFKLREDTIIINKTLNVVPVFKENNSIIPSCPRDGFLT